MTAPSDKLPDYMRLRLIIDSIAYEPEDTTVGERIGALNRADGTVQVKPDAKILWRLSKSSTPCTRKFGTITTMENWLSIR